MPLAHLALAALLAVLLTPHAGRLARRLGALDVADSLRKVHGRPVPRMGGLAIAAGALASAALAWPAAVPGDGRPAGLLAGALLVAAVGVHDDLRGAGAGLKLLIQVAAALLAWGAGFDLELAWSPLGAPLALGPLDLPLTVLWVVGVCNAVNLVDGLDGLAAGLAAIAGAALCLLALWRGDAFVAAAAAATAGAGLGFLVWNRHPAAIFMGDTGSLLLGYLLAVLSLPSAGGRGAPLLPAALVLAVPVADTLLALARRAARGAPIFLGDRGHLHHRLLARGLSPRGAAATLHLAGAAAALAGLLLAATTGAAALGLLGVTLGAAALALRALGFRPLAAGRTVLGERRRNLALRGVVRRAGGELEAAADLSEVWTSVRRAASALGARAARLEVAGRPVGGGDGDHGRARRSRHPLGARGPGALTLEWSGADELDRDREIAVELLCQRVGRAVRRLERRAPRPGPAWLPVPSRAGAWTRSHRPGGGPT